MLGTYCKKHQSKAKLSRNCSCKHSKHKIKIWEFDGSIRKIGQNWPKRSLEDGSKVFSTQCFVYLEYASISIKDTCIILTGLRTEVVWENLQSLQEVEIQASSLERYSSVLLMI